MNRLIAPALLALAFASPATAEVRNLSGFTQVRASAGLDVTVQVGPAFSVNVEGPGASRVITRVDGGRLIVEPTPRIGWGPRPRADIRVTMPTLDGLETSSGAEINARGVNAGAMSLEASSGSEINVAGACRALSASASSGADINARELRCATGEAEASSGADIALFVEGRLDVHASSGGGINAGGDPEIGDVSLSSGGSLRRS